MLLELLNFDVHMVLGSFGVDILVFLDLISAQYKVHCSYFRARVVRRGGRGVRQAGAGSGRTM